MPDAFFRCQSCGAINRVKPESLKSSLACGSCHHETQVENHVMNVNAANFSREVAHWPGIVLLEYWAPGCVHCMHLVPVLDDLARRKAGLLRVAKVNTQFEGSLAAQAGIQGVPTLMLYRAGQLLAKLPGAVPAAQLEAWILQTAGV